MSGILSVSVGREIMRYAGQDTISGLNNTRARKKRFAATGIIETSF